MHGGHIGGHFERKVDEDTPGIEPILIAPQKLRQIRCRSGGVGEHPHAHRTLGKSPVFNPHGPFNHHEWLCGNNE